MSYQHQITKFSGAAKNSKLIVRPELMCKFGVLYTAIDITNHSKSVNLVAGYIKSTSKSHMPCAPLSPLALEPWTYVAALTSSSALGR